MRRFIVGLLATVGFFTLLSIAGVIAFVAWGPLASKPLPGSMVLSLDLRQLPAEAASTDLLSGGLWRGSRDIAETPSNPGLAPGKKSTRKSMSLSSRISPRAADPNSDNSRTWWRRQISAISVSGSLMPAAMLMAVPSRLEEWFWWTW